MNEQHLEQWRTIAAPHWSEHDIARVEERLRSGFIARVVAVTPSAIVMRTPGGARLVEIQPALRDRDAGAIAANAACDGVASYIPNAQPGNLPSSTELFQHRRAPAPADAGNEDPKGEVGAFEPPGGEPEFAAWTDGSGTKATTDAGIGAVILRDAIVIREISRHIGLGSNNTAECWAIGSALKAIEEIAGTTDVPVTIYTDSAWALGAVQPTCTWNLDRTKRSSEVAQQVRRLVNRFPRIAFVKVDGHTGLEFNERADKLAGQARKAGIAAANDQAKAAAGGAP